MPPFVLLARIVGDPRLLPAGRRDRSAYLSALLVLVLFVIWLLASGQQLVPAVLAAVGVSWAADRAVPGRRRISEVDA